MIQVLSPTYPGLICICEKCGALFSYQNSDIYGNLVYCPLCKNGNIIEYDRNYEGIIKPEEKKEDV